jgi:prolipoprotein diacylglyceryl transferase
MNPHFSLFGLTFYWYGLLLGTAIALVLVLVDYRSQLFDQRNKLAKKKRPPSLQLFWQQWSMVLLIGGFVGARLWHVATDWQLYVGRWAAIASLTQGGLSILGGVAGGVITFLLIRRFSPSNRAILPMAVFDSLVFGLPFGQAFGRLGNWVNQELYGLPSTLPWAIEIDPLHRLTSFAEITRYHPLFAYEAIAMLLLGLSIWLVDRKKQHLFGTGFFALLYASVYSALRFGLDFLRIDRPVWFAGLSANQMILLAVLVTSGFLWLKYRNNLIKSNA